MKTLHQLLTNNVDKIAHFAVMYLIVDVLFEIGLSVVFIAIMTFIVAIGKEIFDKIVTLKWSFTDFVATFLGGILSIVINNLI